MQEQIGMWLRILHSDMIPHDPGQGSLHFCCIQALFEEQSELTVHSGRQFGGLPMYVDKQAQDDNPPIFWHSA